MAISRKRSLRRLYGELAEAFAPELLRRAAAGDDQARCLLERLKDVGHQFGAPALSVATEPADLTAAVDALIRPLIAERRVPRVTYRLQFNSGFTFRDACRLVPYLHALGVSDCYASPILRAHAGSSHGYDICDHSSLNPELGNEDDFNALAAALRERDMGLVLDVVPNHMGIGDPGNVWWLDVLENGPASLYASFFDIDWRPVNPDLKNKVLLPLLEDQYGRVLEAGKIRLEYAKGAFSLCYCQVRLPVAPCTYSCILERALAGLGDSSGATPAQVRELRSILTALRNLPLRTAVRRDRIAERHLEKEVIKQRLAALCSDGPEVLAAIDEALLAFNGQVGDPHSFDALHALMERQAYRLAFWRVATEEINYRRFFDVSDLAAIRMELPEVFQATHELVFRLLAEGKATGLRIDHPDGLRDPAGYFRQLQTHYTLARARATHPDLSEELAQAVAERLAMPAAAPGPLYVVAEKILMRGEELPQDWAVDGTTGYDFLNLVNGLFVHADGREALDRTYQGFTGVSTDFQQMVVSAKKMTMLVSMVSEINALAHQLDRIAERNRCCRDFTLNSLTFALREVVACLTVYRTYITGPDEVAAQDRQAIHEAVEEAKLRNPRTAEAVFDFIRDAVLLSAVQEFPEVDRPQLVDWALKFQQLTGPIMAKGVEDTVFYTFNRLSSLNEVGGAPDRYGVSLAAFHAANVKRLERWPHTLLATSTHDTKRSEDVRARLNVLSELTADWTAALARWTRLNSSKKSVVDNQPAPDRNDEYLLYQTLLGAWPEEPLTSETLAQFRQRIANYMSKTTKEAKVHTSWINPNDEYDEAVRLFVERLLSGSEADPFLEDFQGLQRRVACFGHFNSLAQLLLKLTCPGVPDLYQGSELWDLALVDPDNRRPIDFASREQALGELERRISRAENDLASLATELLANPADGWIKTYVLWQTLRLRQARHDLFTRGSYLPLDAAGPGRDHVCAFARCLDDARIVVVVPRLTALLAGDANRPPTGPETWRQTPLSLPPQWAGSRFRNIFTGEVLTYDGHQEMVDVILGQFPVALLTCLGDSAVS